MPEECFLAAVDALVDADRDWVPTGPDQTLYIRPYRSPASRSSASGRRTSTCSWSSPARPARTSRAGCTRCRCYLSEDYIRAAPGGTGDIKCAGNYAASLLAQEQAIEAGCDQVVWLDASEKRYVEEMGGMNLFFVLGSGADAELVTPELTGTLLPGITRDSLIEVARSMGHTVSERRFSVDEWRAGVADGTVTETFACGTAAVITPVGEVKARTGDFTVGDGTPGPLTMSAARDAPGHPARAGGRHPRLAAPGRLSDRAEGTRLACCAGGAWRRPRGTWAARWSPSACTTASTAATRS